MAIMISEYRMTLAVDGAEVATATWTDDRWITSTWPHTLAHEQAITGHTPAERLAQRHGDNDPFVIAWREELANG